MIPQNDEKSSLSFFFRWVGMGRLLAQAGVRSRTVGIPGTALLQFLMGLICTERNLWRWFVEARVEQGDALPFEKSTVYAFLKNPRIHWRRLLFMVSARTTAWVHRFSASRDAVFIVDDSLFDRHRSQHVDFLSNVFDHVEHRFRWGFRWLTLGWSDGTTFLPVAFSLLGSRNPRHRRSSTVSPIDARTVGARRRREVIQPAPSMVVQLLQEALTAGISARFVLFDRWFTTGKLVANIRQTTGLHVIGMVKASPHVYYEYSGGPRPGRYTLTQLYRRVVRPAMARRAILGSCCVTVSTDHGPLPLRIVFVRDRRGASKKWLALWSTDRSVSDDEVVRTYGKRWAMETFFKVAKSLLGIPREYQGRSYEGMVAHTTIVCLRYQWLALQARTAEDVRTLGDLFFVQCQELEDLAFGWVIDQILTAFAATLAENLELDEAQIGQLFQEFLHRVPERLRDRLRRTASIGLLKSA